MPDAHLWSLWIPHSPATSSSVLFKRLLPLVLFSWFMLEFFRFRPPGTQKLARKVKRWRGRIARCCGWRYKCCMAKVPWDVVRARGERMDRSESYFFADTERTEVFARFKSPRLLNHGVNKMLVPIKKENGPHPRVTACPVEVQ